VSTTIPSESEALEAQAMDETEAAMGSMREASEASDHVASTRQAAIEDLARVNKEQEQAEIDQEIEQEAIFETKVRLSVDRHNKLVYIPFLEALMFGLGDRFPLAPIMIALDNVFNPTHWPLTMEQFDDNSYLKDHIGTLSAHFGQQCTYPGAEEVSAIDADALILETTLAKTWLRESYGALLGEKAKITSQQAAAPVADVKPKSAFTNPLLKSASAAAQTTLSSHLDAPKPADVCVSMLDVIVKFVQVYGIGRLLCVCFLFCVSRTHMTLACALISGRRHSTKCAQFRALGANCNDHYRVNCIL
jgi:hypothetical protein